MSEKVVITGANGWIGGKLAHQLMGTGWKVVGVSRTPDRARERHPEAEWVGLDEAFDNAVEEVGVVVNLAGRHLLERPWDEEFKAAVYESRVGLTRRVVEALGKSRREKKVLINGSGYPVYGDTGEALVSEEDPVSRSTFLSALDADWEDAARKAESFVARVALMRIGLVFGSDGGAFPVLRQPFDEGAGIVLGSGKQWIPWIHIEDVVRILARALTDERFHGPINVVAPNPVRHREFAQTLSRLLGKPCEVTVPEEQLTAKMGEAAELLLSSIRMEPRRLASFGIEFRYPELEGALRAIVKAGS